MYVVKWTLDPTKYVQKMELRIGEIVDILKRLKNCQVNPTTPINSTTLGDQEAELDSLGENDCPGSEDLPVTSQGPTGSTSPTRVPEETRTRYGSISWPPSYIKDYVSTLHKDVDCKT